MHNFEPNIHLNHAKYYLVAVSQSTGGWTFLLMFVFSKKKKKKKKNILKKYVHSARLEVY